jgi:3-oxoadipate enol-lactonase
MRILAGDLETAWFEWGRGEPLILVHGLGEDHRSWRKLVPCLALRHRVIAYDLRGHGETEPGRPDGSLAQLAGDLLALLDRLGLDSCDLVGFSLGGTIVLRLAADHPHRVRRLVPVATSSRVGRAAVAWYEERAQLADAGNERLWPTLEADTHGQLDWAPEELSDLLLVRRQATADPRGFGSACRAMAGLGAQPLDGDLARITAPTLVVAGELDSHCPPRAGQTIADRIPGARLQVLPRAGHHLPLGRPRELCDALLEFLDA